MPEMVHGYLVMSVIILKKVSYILRLFKVFFYISFFTQHLENIIYFFNHLKQIKAQGVQENTSDFGDFQFRE